MVFARVLEVAGNTNGCSRTGALNWKGMGRCGVARVGEVLIEMLKCSNQLVPRVERFGSRTLRRWLEHRREKHDEGMRVSGVPQY